MLVLRRPIQYIHGAGTVTISTNDAFYTIQNGKKINKYRCSVEVQKHSFLLYSVTSVFTLVIGVITSILFIIWVDVCL